MTLCRCPLSIFCSRGTLPRTIEPTNPESITSLIRTGVTPAPLAIRQQGGGGRDLLVLSLVAHEALLLALCALRPRQRGPHVVPVDAPHCKPTKHTSGKHCPLFAGQPLPTAGIFLLGEVRLDQGSSATRIDASWYSQERQREPGCAGRCSWGVACCASRRGAAALQHLPVFRRDVPPAPQSQNRPPRPWLVRPALSLCVRQYPVP